MLFISEWDGRYDWLQTTAEHDIIWSMWVGDHGELFFCIGLHLNGEWQYHAKSNELTYAFLACPPDWAQGPSLLRDKRGLPLSDCGTIVPVLWLLFSKLVDAFKFPTLVGQFIREPSCTILLWQIKIFDQNNIFLWNFHSWFCLIFTDI